MAVATSVGEKPSEKRRASRLRRSQLRRMSVAGSGSGAAGQRGLSRPRRRSGAMDKARNDDGMATRRDRGEVQWSKMRSRCGRERLAHPEQAEAACYWPETAAGNWMLSTHLPTSTPRSRFSHERPATFPTFPLPVCNSS